MAGTAASVERVRDRATGLDKFVLREARGSSVEVSSPFRRTVPSPLLSESVLLDLFIRKVICASSSLVSPPPQS